MIALHVTFRICSLKLSWLPMIRITAPFALSALLVFAGYAIWSRNPGSVLERYPVATGFFALGFFLAGSAIISGAIKRWKSPRFPRGWYESDRSFAVDLYIVLNGGSYVAGPFVCTLWAVLMPYILLSDNMLRSIGAPVSGGIKSRRVWLKEGSVFLHPARTYLAQRVHAGHTLVVTDSEDAEMLRQRITALLTSPEARRADQLTGFEDRPAAVPLQRVR